MCARIDPHNGEKGEGCEELSIRKGLLCKDLEEVNNYMYSQLTIDICYGFLLTFMEH